MTIAICQFLGQWFSLKSSQIDAVFPYYRNFKGKTEPALTKSKGYGHIINEMATG
jgi:hypothetical protein